MVETTSSDGQILRAFAVTKALYNQGMTKADILLPLIMSCVSKNEYQSTRWVQSQIKFTYGLPIPTAVIAQACNSLSRRDLVKKKGKRWVLSNAGIKLLDSRPDLDSIDRKLGELRDRFSSFCRNQEINIPIADPLDLITQLIERNLFYYIRFIESSATSFIETPSINRKVELHVASFLDYCYKSDVTSYETIRELVIGSIMLETARVGSTGSQKQIPNRLKDSSYYLDANFIIFLLGIAEPERVSISKELLKMLKKEGASIGVFDFTIEEIKVVVKQAEDQLKITSETYPRGGLAQQFRSMNYTKSDVLLFSRNFEECLFDLDIAIVNTDVNLGTYQPSSDGWRESAVPFWPTKGKRVQNHDLAAVEQVRSLRKIHASEKTYFISSDFSLQKWVVEGLHAGIVPKFPEVLFDKALTCLLWYENPDLDISLREMLQFHSGGPIVSDAVWKRFCEELESIHTEGTASIEALGDLLQSGILQYTLQDVWEEDIDSNFVMSLVQRAERDRKEKFRDAEEKNRRIHTEYRERLHKERRVRRKTAEKWDAAKSREQSILKSREKHWHRLISIGYFLVIMTSVVIFLILGYYIGFTQLLGLTNGVMGLLVGIFGVGFFPTMNRRIRAFVARKIWDQSIFGVKENLSKNEQTN